jgi:hypothetical protein
MAAHALGLARTRHSAAREAEGIAAVYAMLKPSLGW